MAVRFYVSCRPLLWQGAWMTPNTLLASSFTGMPLRFVSLAWRPEIDGRMLYQIDVDTLEHRSVVMEALTWFGCHAKTLGSAKELAELVTGQSYDLNGDPAAIYCSDSEGLIAPEPGPMVPPPA
ncbi:hypothetical protein GBZ48_31555 [Azospirillum melinis]|uniref:Uncharacterized protein n=1 Tax=Azospirillum melinis TaxID=328839 RepID=A0ABX2KKV8_9PROT|nr:hypothetical protein [Azospirillum melinis]MBP2310486.1 hypothetical protein [Azospirillum melinis]NUB03754.1 hypothetical protein [Azospirillum melinis]